MQVQTEYKKQSIVQWVAIVPASYLEIRYFFILQSLTTSKIRKFQILKLSQFLNAKTCWTENWQSSGIMSNFWGGKKNLKNFLENILATALKSYIKWLKKVEKQATTHDILVGNHECNTERDFKNQLYIELGWGRLEPIFEECLNTFVQYLLVKQSSD